MKKLTTVAASVAAVFMTGAAHASFLFDFDGTGGAFGAQQVQAFDWGPTSFLASGGQTAIANWISSSGQCPNNSCTFDVFTHATLIGAFAPGNTTMNLPGVGNTWEITMVAKFSETVTFANSALGLAQFASVPTSGWVELYYQRGADANALTGSGFDNGRLILSGSGVSAGIGNFTINPLATLPGTNTPAPIQSLDQTGADDYRLNASTTQQTVVGTGSNTNLSFENLTTDPEFFKNGLSAFGLSFANVSIGLPYISVDPSDCFNNTVRGIAAVGSTGFASTCDTLHTNNLMSAQTGGLNMLVPRIGPINGLFFNSETTPDFVAQSDFNSPMTGRIPEPGAVGLVGLGLGIMGLISGRRRRAR